MHTLMIVQEQFMAEKENHSRDKAKLEEYRVGSLNSSFHFTNAYYEIGKICANSRDTRNHTKDMGKGAPGST